MTSPDVELAHFGVKGMRWGVRRESNKSRVSSKKALTPDQIIARRARNARIAVGAVIAAKILLDIGNARVATMLNNRATMATGMKALERSNIITANATRGVFKITTL